VWLAALMPAALGLGPRVAVITCGVMVLALLRSELILAHSERTQLQSFAIELLGRITPLVRRRRVAAGG
jgi:hypothetical protein